MLDVSFGENGIFTWEGNLLLMICGSVELNLEATQYQMLF